MTKSPKQIFIKSVILEGSIPLVTLDRTTPVRAAEGAFARLRPVEGQTPEEIDAWRHSVAAIAHAVKVLPVPKSDAVSADNHRTEEQVGTIREEALKIAEETKNADVITLVREVLNAVGAP